MRFKKKIVAVFVLSMTMFVLAGCRSQIATNDALKKTEAGIAATEETKENESAGELKMGLSITTSVSHSKDATVDEEGLAQSDILLVAVAVDEAGVINDCVIDMVQTQINFNAAGELVTDPTTEFVSKNELGDAYGMHKASSIGREWNEQAAAMAAYAVGKTVDELKGIAVNENGAPTDADLATSVTISIGDFIAGIEDAVNKAE